MAKKVDENGYITYEDVLISREGVFDYAGFQIDPEGKSLEAKKIYKVYRPKSEVCKKDFIVSLENKPLVDDHTMLGAYGKAAEKKGVHGVLTDVKAVGNELHGTITVWSEAMKSKISNGKRELSLGYTGYFRKQSGRFEGQVYDFVQFGLSANHIALVDDARMGHACKLMDSAVVICDSISLEKPMPNDKKSCGDELIEKLKGCSDEDIAKVKDYLASLEKKETTQDKDAGDAGDAGDAKEAQDEAEKKAAEEEAAKAKAAEDAKAKEDAEKKAAEDEAAKKAAEEAKAKEEADKKAAEDKKACEDAAIAEYVKAEALAKRCEPIFGNIVMDGLRTEKDVAVKVCAMDSALKFVDADKALDALTVRIGEFEKNASKQKAIADAKVTVNAKFDFLTAFQSR